MLFYTPVNFNIAEFVPKEIFEKKGINPFWFVSPYLLWTADQLRIRYKKPIYINTWSFGDKQAFNYRGYRQPTCTAGAPLSMHRLGLAMDFNVENMTSIEVQNDLIKNPNIEPFKYITCVEKEAGVEKTHIDLRPHDREKLGIIILSN